MYANDEPTSWEGVPVAGDTASAPFVAEFADHEEDELSPVQLSEPELRPEVAQQLDSGTLMSFLTDFRSAELDILRKQREEELAKTRKRVPRRVVPEPVEDETEAPVDYVDGGYSADVPQSDPVPDPSAVPQWDAPQASGQDVRYWTPPQAPQPAPQPALGRKLRLPFGIGSKNVQQSPATT